MRTLLLTVFAVLVGCAFGQRNLETMPEKIFPIDPIGPIKPWSWPARGCNARHGGWSYEQLPQNQWPQSNNAKVFYFGCKVWRPTWSSCTGKCDSVHNITMSGTRPRETTDCKCCKSAGTQSVRPYPICLVIRIDHGQILSVHYETVRQRTSYRYTLAAKCGCQTCGRRQPSIFSGSKVEQVDEARVTGRPTPPEVSGVDLNTELSTAARTIPGLSGVLSGGLGGRMGGGRVGGGEVFLREH